MEGLFFVPLRPSSIPFSTSYKKVMKNMLHQMHFMTIFSNFFYEIPMANICIITEGIISAEVAMFIARLSFPFLSQEH